MGNETEKPAEPKSNLNWNILIPSLISNVGTGGTLVVIGVLFFIFYGTTEQHKQFIDQYILLNLPDGQTKYFYISLSVVLIIFILDSRFNRKKIKLKDERIKSLEQNIQYLQKLLAKKK